MLQSSKQAWLTSIALVLLFAVWDFFTRLDAVSSNVKAKSNVESQFINAGIKLDAELKNKILALFSLYDLPPPLIVKTPVKVSAAKAGLSIAQQNKQSGELAQLYLGDYRYTPLGVFKESNLIKNSDKVIFAVLIQQNVNTNVTKEIKVVLNQSLSPYRVSNITDTMIEFSAKTRVVQLSLFK